jgi:stage II sporulation protein D (peptidoglycan lytic transglycosylase)
LPPSSPSRVGPPRSDARARPLWRCVRAVVALAGAAPAFGLTAAACASNRPPRPAAGGRSVAQGDVRPLPDSERLVGVALTAGALSGRVSATGAWRLYATGGSRLVVRGTGRGVWTVSRRGDRLRLASADGLTTTRDGPLIAQAAVPGSFVTWNGRQYRGVLEISTTAGGLLVVNRLPVEDYLRGVVALELGNVTEAERAALEAQAVAARSYTYVRLDDPDIPPGERRFDLVATVIDQVYGGVGGETRLGNEAVARTAGEVITYDGRVVNAPYHAACGGTTAGPPEVWRQAPIPYLQRVSDQIPGTDHYYCEGSATFRWSRTFTRGELAAAVDRYLRTYAMAGATDAAAPSAPADAGPVGAVRAVAVDSLTASGRVAALAITTDRGTFHVRGNDIRFVLRVPNGEILNSTYFLIEDEPVRDGRVASLTLRGRGNGHGVGMCQWGAIGRARAGQDYRTILQTYYPGTTLAQVDGGQ